MSSQLLLLYGYAKDSSVSSPLHKRVSLGLNSVCVIAEAIYDGFSQDHVFRAIHVQRFGVECLLSYISLHRSSETCVCIRGHFEEYFYDSEGQLTETIDMVPGGVVLNIEAGQWHSLKCLESGTVLLEAKDGEYAPLGPEDILTV